MMETLVETITDEHAASDLGAVAAANIPDLPKQKSGTIRFIKKSAPVIASSAEADRISDLVHQIENLKESDAKARLLELENAHEKTYFEIGGVLSVMQKGKWYDPCASLASDARFPTRPALERSASDRKSADPAARVTQATARLAPKSTRFRPRCSSVHRASPSTLTFLATVAKSAGVKPLSLSTNPGGWGIRSFRPLRRFLSQPSQSHGSASF